MEKTILPIPDSIYLCVPYSRNQIAKSLGCWWDSDLKTWYIPKNKVSEENEKKLLQLFDQVTYYPIVHLPLGKYRYKEEIKVKGGKWDKEKRMWYTPNLMVESDRNYLIGRFAPTHIQANKLKTNNKDKKKLNSGFVYTED